jgi:hypothetical protein
VLPVDVLDTLSVVTRLLRAHAFSTQLCVGFGVAKPVPKTTFTYLQLFSGFVAMLTKTLLPLTLAALGDSEHLEMWQRQRWV